MTIKIVSRPVFRSPFPSHWAALVCVPCTVSGHEFDCRFSSHWTCGRVVKAFDSSSNNESCKGSNPFGFRVAFLIFVFCLLIASLCLLLHVALLVLRSSKCASLLLFIPSWLHLKSLPHENSCILVDSSAPTLKQSSLCPQNKASKLRPSSCRSFCAAMTRASSNVRTHARTRPRRWLV